VRDVSLMKWSHTQYKKGEERDYRLEKYQTKKINELTYCKIVS